MKPSQRRGFIRQEFDAKGVYGELDYIHQILNSLNFPLGIYTQESFSASVEDSRIYCMRPSLSIFLPSLGKESDGWMCFVQDRQGSAASGNISIIAPPGKLIKGVSGSAKTLLISANYGAHLVQWDFKNDAYYEIS